MKAEGSNPSMSTIFSLLAQLVERLVYIQNVGGSNPSGTTRLEAVDLVTSHF